MFNNKKITVVLPAYNASSTLEQTYKEIPFDIDQYTKWRLMEGLDDIGLTLQKTDEISEFEKNRADFKPKTLPILK